VVAALLRNHRDSARVPFEWTVNPYRGCAFGCRYCYATYTHEYLGLEAKAGFHSAIYAKTGGLDEGARRLALAVRVESGWRSAPPPIPIGRARPTSRSRGAFSSARRSFGACDSTSPPRARSSSVTSTLLQRIHERSLLSVQISLTSLHGELLRRPEPWAPPPQV
jgi:hypothetical protein